MQHLRNALTECFQIWHNPVICQCWTDLILVAMGKMSWSHWHYIHPLLVTHSNQYMKNTLKTFFQIYINYPLKMFLKGFSTGMKTGKCYSEHDLFSSTYCIVTSIFSDILENSEANLVKTINELPQTQLKVNTCQSIVWISVFVWDL